MKTGSLLDKDWSSVVTRPGGATALNATARATKASPRPREIRCAVDLLRLILAYCLGDRGLRATAAWAGACPCEGGGLPLRRRGATVPTYSRRVSRMC
jgi:hypothetical protein